MTLDIPKRGRGRPKKIVVEPDANKIIDIWLKEEPEPESSQEKDALTDIRSAAELILILVATIGILMWIYFRMVGV